MNELKLSETSPLSKSPPKDENMFLSSYLDKVTTIS